MSRTLEVEKLDDLDIALNVARKMFDDKGKLHIIVKLFEESLSDKQRGLYWRWVGTVIADTGDTKVDFHNQYKENVFLPIYLADPDNHQDLCDVVTAMKKLRSTSSEVDYFAVRRYIVSRVSHLDATVKNMKDVLKQLKADAISLGIRLPPPPGPGLTYQDQYEAAV